MAIGFTLQAPRPVAVDQGPSLGWLATAEAAEGLGYEAISLPDHLAGAPGDQLAPLTALAVAMAATTELRATTTVLAVGFRHPVVLAKELATLDVLSDGRAGVGLGAGWLRADYEGAGLPFPSAGERLDQLAEAVHVLRGLWSGQQFSFSGDHYAVRDLVGSPVPAQPGGPPITMGGGARRALALAGRLADEVNVALDNRAGVVGGGAGLERQMDERVGWVREGAEGRAAPPRLGLRVLACEVTNRPCEVAGHHAARLGVDVDTVLASPHTLIGPIDALEDEVRALHDRWGFSNFVVGRDALFPLSELVERLRSDP